MRIADGSSSCPASQGRVFDSGAKLSGQACGRTSADRSLPGSRITLKKMGLTFHPGDELVRFVAWNLEPYRGFNRFMCCLENRRMPHRSGPHVSHINAPLGNAGDVGGREAGEFTPQGGKLIGLVLAVGAAEADAGLWHSTKWASARLSNQPASRQLPIAAASKGVLVWGLRLATAARSSS
jgi:hypothetical protein